MFPASLGGRVLTKRRKGVPRLAAALGFKMLRSFFRCLKFIHLYIMQKRVYKAFSEIKYNS